MRQFLQTILKSGAAVAPSSAASTKTIAKERLQIILAHQRGSQALAGVDLGALQEELLACVQRHIAVAQGEKVNIAVKQEGSMDIFEMQVPVSALPVRATTP
ncbi:cell division topological specificity factor MinE [Saprolegnia diclina VS20]|uniref:Cell division topological specificity factor MinE n=1 Tax=Saprolegnia diclina (strain VS20) TaxID=1156394 RepID=T0S1M9_SAPDV|nr:cell division topological specificity factor MinE [Saprolegnia diclina VS20]EQC38933.1 cell division topological specificity factor MinE [Saprolegnia diclina VS20]|eukprot:XP_008607757.1 cell division topological specificity factor MinE [Saprolegnia diclina VS20]